MMKNWGLWRAVAELELPWEGRFEGRRDGAGGGIGGSAGAGPGEGDDEPLRTLCFTADAQSAGDMDDKGQMEVYD